ncbi:MAG: hypothetical protein ACREAT_08405, partial [Nitrosotalea sp.]
MLKTTFSTSYQKEHFWSKHWFIPSHTKISIFYLLKRSRFEILLYHYKIMSLTQMSFLDLYMNRNP